MGNICKKCNFYKKDKTFSSESRLLIINQNKGISKNTNNIKQKCKSCHLIYSRNMAFNEYCSDQCYWNSQMAITL